MMRFSWNRSTKWESPFSIRREGDQLPFESQEIRPLARVETIASIFPSHTL
jgi:hypothetical protein